jgi:hypothetical protein
LPLSIDEQEGRGMRVKIKAAACAAAEGVRRRRFLRRRAPAQRRALSARRTTAVTKSKSGSVGGVSPALLARRKRRKRAKAANAYLWRAGVAVLRAAAGAGPSRGENALKPSSTMAYWRIGKLGNERRRTPTSSYEHSISA